MANKVSKSVVAGALAATLSGPALPADNGIASSIGDYMRGQQSVLVNGAFQKTIQDIIKEQMKKNKDGSSKADDGTLNGLMEKAIIQATEVVKIGGKKNGVAENQRIVIDNSVANQVFVIDPAAQSFAILATKEVDYSKFTARAAAATPAMAIDEGVKPRIFRLAGSTITEAEVIKNGHTAVALENKLRDKGMGY